MRAIFDISVLGASQLDTRSRTGIFRVVERLARGLAGSPECDLSFSALVCSERSLDYSQCSPGLREIPCLRHESSSSAGAHLIQAGYHLGQASGGRLSRLPLRVGGSLLYRSGKLAESRRHALLRQMLDQADVFHSPFLALPPRSKGRGRAQRFLTVYDLTPILFPHFFAFNEDQLVRSIFASVGPEDWILCISESCRQDLCDHYPEIDPARVFVTHLAAEPELFYPCRDADRTRAVRAKYRIPDAPYLLALSTLQPRKNLDHVIHCFGKLARQRGLDDLHLVLVGPRGWRDGKIFDAIRDLGPLQERVILPGYVADEDLAPLYTGAMVFLYPSFYEGFGLPPLEAMQCGVPVITSNTSSLPEVVGDAGIMLEPTDADGLCQAIVEIFERPSLRDRLSARSMQQARRFSWERCTAQTIDAYKAAISGVPPCRDLGARGFPRAGSDLVLRLL